MPKHLNGFGTTPDVMMVEASSCQAYWLVRKTERTDSGTTIYTKVAYARNYRQARHAG